MRIKGLASLLVVGYSLVFLMEQPVAAAVSVPVASRLSAQSAVLLDPRSNKVLYAKKPYLERPAASTTKIMTALVVLERLPLSRVIRVSKSAERIAPSKMYLKMGERFYARDLLKAVLISSANDAAYTLAVAVAGSEGRFAQLMNANARRLGARHTRFTNASGLPFPRGQYTTAYDLALIMKEARKSLFISQTLALRTSGVRALTGRRVFLRNHNRMLWKRPHTVEGKTGFTRRALHCFVGKIHAPRRGEVLVAMMGSVRPWRDLMILIGITNQINPLQIQFNRLNLSVKQVAMVQRAVWQAGFPCGRVDGIFGPKTLRAVKAFQRSRGLAPDGIVGTKTWTALRRLFRY